MSTQLTPTQRIAWEAIGHAQEHWGAVLKAIDAVRAHHIREAGDAVALLAGAAEICDATEDSVAGIQAAARHCYRVARGDERLFVGEPADVVGLAEAFPDAVQIEPASPPQSTETADLSTLDVSDTPDAERAAFAALDKIAPEWRHEYGAIHETEIRAVVAAVRPLIEAEALHALISDLERHGMNGIDVRNLRVRAGCAISHPRQTGGCCG